MHRSAVRTLPAPLAAAVALALGGTAALGGALALGGTVALGAPRALAASDAVAPARASAADTARTFLVVYDPGPLWDHDRGPSEQPDIRDHGRFLIQLYIDGIMTHAGPFPDTGGGAVVIRAADLEAAHAIVASDPAVVSGLMVPAIVREWIPRDWDEFVPRSDGARAGGEPAAELPAEFRAHRIFLRPVTADGDTLVFYTDSGGGTNMLYEPAASRFGIPTERVAFGQESVTVAPWPRWRADASIPRPLPEVDPLEGRLLVVPVDGESPMVHDPDDVGFLGRIWFANRVWTIDYPAERLLLRLDGDVPPHDAAHRVPLGFQTNDAGARTTHFPRIPIVVAGDTLETLFDTGATKTLTDAALAELADGGPARRASTFISANVFDAWREAHPDWRVIARGTELDADLIEVPEIVIAGHEVGPVWFERRPAGTFEEYMSQWMDRPIVGALGGNALRWFRVTIDYPGAVAIFERPR